MDSSFITFDDRIKFPCHSCHFNGWLEASLISLGWQIIHLLFPWCRSWPAGDHLCLFDTKNRDIRFVHLGLCVWRVCESLPAIRFPLSKVDSNETCGSSGPGFCGWWPHPGFWWRDQSTEGVSGGKCHRFGWGRACRLIGSRLRERICTLGSIWTRAVRPGVIFDQFWWGFCNPGSSGAQCGQWWEVEAASLGRSVHIAVGMSGSVELRVPVVVPQPPSEALLAWFHSSCLAPGPSWKAPVLWWSAEAPLAVLRYPGASPGSF